MWSLSLRRVTFFVKFVKLNSPDNMTDIFKGLNSRQREAVEATEGRIDSGSTRTLRAAFLRQSDLPE